MRATTAIASTASALLLLLSVSGCAQEASTSTPIGPNGYTLAGSIEGTEVEVWYDYAEAMNATDIVLMDGNDVVGVCLGGDGTMCIEGDKYDVPYGIFIAPANAASADLAWGGAAPIPMNLAVTGVEDERSRVFVIAPPPIAAGGLATPTMTAYDANGQVVASANS